MKSSPLTLCFLMIVAFDAVTLILATGVVSTGNDAAGNGTINGFRQGFAEAGVVVLALLALVFFVIRHRGIRITLMASRMPLTLFCLLLTR